MNQEDQQSDIIESFSEKVNTIDAELKLQTTKEEEIVQQNILKFQQEEREGIMNCKQSESKEIIPSSNHEQNDIHDIISNLNIDELSRQNLISSRDHFAILLELGQDLSQVVNNNDELLKLAIQMCKLSVIGNLQIEQTIRIINFKGSPSEFDPAMQLQNVLQRYSVNAKSSDDLNLSMMNLILEFQIKEIISPIEILTQSILNMKTFDKRTIRRLKILLSKMKSLIEMFPFALATEQKDLFSLERSDKEWSNIYQKVSFKILGTPECLKNSFDKFLGAIIAANAMIHKSNEYENGMMKNIVEGFGAAYYMLAAKKEGQEIAQEFFSDPPPESAFKVWNLGEQGMMKTLMPIIFENIKFNKKIYLDRQFMQIDTDYIIKQYKNDTVNKISPQNTQVDGSKLPTLKELFKESPNKICVRILNHKVLECYEGPIHQFQKMDSHPKYKPNSDSAFNKMFKNPLQVYEKIIIHIHGGGFVSMSSRSHQTYTRQWANNLQVPVFSIDYRKAPQDPFPAGLDDCWQAYLWIINYSQFYFNIDPKQVVLVGDSAGGNLVAALTILCIKSGVRVPDGILLAYPALNLHQQYFTPSLLIALDDSLLPHTVLRLILTSYINNTTFDAQKDPLLSPSKVSNEILKFFPRTRIVAGTNDPLHDESWRLAQKLVKLQKDFHMIIYQGMPHGFLSFDTPHGMKECKVTVEDAKDLLSELLTSSDYVTQMDEYYNGQLNQVNQWGVNLQQKLQ